MRDRGATRTAVLAGLAGLVFSAGARAEAVWVTHPEADDLRPVVLRFERDLDLDSVPGRMPVEVTADSRFVLHVNGARVGAGPAVGDLAHWHTERFDLAPYLKPGRNVVTAAVWNFVKPDKPIPATVAGQDRVVAEYMALLEQTGPAAHLSARTGFLVRAESPDAAALDSGPGWRVRIDRGHGAQPGMTQFRDSFYVAGAPEVIDATVPAGAWVPAVPALAPGEAPPWTLRPSPLPQMLYRPVDSGRLVRSDLADARTFPAGPVTVPAGRHVRLLLQRDAMVSAYPELGVSGGRGARIRVTYAEALVDAEGRKGVRDAVADRRAVGLTDSFTADGGRRSFAPLWWRTWRFLELDVETADQPLVLEGLKTYETGYPFDPVGRFRSSDPQLDAIWQIGWRTARIDAHETYQDSSYYEQLQYVGDTRLQALITHAVSGDTRLPVQAIDAFGWSNVDGGLTEGAYPSRRPNIITTFSLLWIGMMHDHWWRQPDTAVIRRNLPRMREVLAWFAPYQQATGLLSKTPHWNFVDWAGQRADDREIFPSFDAKGQSCLTTLHYLGALDQAADLEQAVGEAARVADLRARAGRARDGLRRLCWDAGRGLFADSPARTAFSQHSNILAVLYDVAEAGQAPAILSRILPGKGIDAPEGLFASRYYFAWYLARALEHAGLADRYLGLLDSWRALLPLNFTTWPEDKSVNSRSDSHAWSAHPTADLLGIVAGIGPGAPGYARIRIAPHLGPLTDLEATAQTPHGPVSVRYRVGSDGVAAEIDKPGGAPGEFIWKDRTYRLADGVTRLTLPR